MKLSSVLRFVTPTWSGDLVHFNLMRASVERSTLRAVPHQVVVQTEDVELFRQHAGPAVEVLTTEQVLPDNVEAFRQQARRQSARLGRGGTRVLGSIARYIGWPGWVNYTGWHVQQITKLALAAASTVDTVVILDSDVVITRHAKIVDFFHPTKLVCFEERKSSTAVPNKVLNWNRQAHRLFEQPFSADAAVDSYFDTPFIFHAPTVRKMLAWLEQRYQKAWWEVLLSQPPRRWSEFGTYRTFLRAFPPEQGVEWRLPDKVRYLFDASDPQALRDKFARLLDDPGCHFVTIHSQSSGRQLWSATDYAPLILPLLDLCDGAGT